MRREEKRREEKRRRWGGKIALEEEKDVCQVSSIYYYWDCVPIIWILAKGSEELG